MYWRSSTFDELKYLFVPFVNPGFFGRGRLICPGKMKPAQKDVIRKDVMENVVNA